MRYCTGHLWAGSCVSISICFILVAFFLLCRGGLPTCFQGYHCHLSSFSTSLSSSGPLHADASDLTPPTGSAGCPIISSHTKVWSFCEWLCLESFCSSGRMDVCEWMDVDVDEHDAFFLIFKTGWHIQKKKLEKWLSLRIRSA